MKSIFRFSTSAGARRYVARALLGLLTTVGVLGHVTGEYTIPYVNQIENLLYDTRVRLSAPGGVDDRIVIVAIDEDSLERLGHWPFTREKFAVLMNNLFAYGAAVVAFDVLFAERDEGADVALLRQLATEDGDDRFLQRLDELEPRIDRDRLFAEALQYGPSVMGYYFDTNPETAYVTGELPFPAFDLHESMLGSMFLPRGAGYSSNLAVLMESAYSAGFISNPLIDRDGVVRRTPLLHEYNLAVYESLSLATAATFLNDITLPIFVDASTWMGDYPPLESLELAGRPIPIDPQGAVLVPFRGPRGSFPYVSFADVVHGELEDPTILDGRIALIGATAPGMEDLRTTPFGSIYPGVEVHANVIAGLLDGNFRWEPAYTAAAEMITVLAFGLFSALVLPILSPLLSTLVLLTLAAGGAGRQLLHVGGRAARAAAGHDAVHAVRDLHDQHAVRLPVRSTQPLAHGQPVRPVRAARPGQGHEPRPRTLLPGQREARTVGAVHRHPRLYLDFRRPGRRRTVATDGRVPDADDAHRARNARHHRQVHRRRGHGVLGRADLSPAPCGPGGRGGFADAVRAGRRSTSVLPGRAGRRCTSEWASTPA